MIGGANLMGGAGTAFGAVVGAALIEVIRNSLILLGISTFWQGTFVGSFIIVAVLFDRLRTGALRRLTRGRSRPDAAAGTRRTPRSPAVAPPLTVPLHDVVADSPTAAGAIERVALTLSEVQSSASHWRPRPCPNHEE